MCWNRDRRARASENVVLRRPRLVTSLRGLLLPAPALRLELLHLFPRPLPGPIPFLLGPRRRGRRRRRRRAPERRLPPRRGRRRPGLALARDLAALLHLSRRRRPLLLGPRDHGSHRRRRPSFQMRRRRRRRSSSVRLARARPRSIRGEPEQLRLKVIEANTYFLEARRERRHLHLVAAASSAYGLQAP